MGLKTTNYTIKRTGQFLPTAYAKLRTLAFNSDDTVRATFGIHETREKMEVDKLDPYEIVSVECGKWDRKEMHLDEFVYKTAKTKIRKTYNWDEEKKAHVETVEYGPLYGWDNDIVKGDTQ